MTNTRCAMTGAEMEPGDGIWEDGEWISWEWINSQLEGEPEEEAREIEPFRSREGFPFSVVEQTGIFYDLVDCARRHLENTGRYLQIWGELGEIYAEIKFGLRRHGSLKAGSDGTIEGRLVEVKTISPEKKAPKVSVKRKGDFEQLLVVSISPDFEFQSRLFERSELRGATGKLLRIALPNAGGEG